MLEAVVLGLHLVSVHVPALEDQNNFNPGVYARLENGVTFGVYYNTFKRATVYGGWTTPEWYRMRLTIGIATGYQRSEVPCNAYGWTSCWTAGNKAYLTPMLAPSVRLPDVMGVTPRLSFIPGLGRSNVFHLSVERSWK